MAQADAEAIRAYLDALNQFIAVVKEAQEAQQPFWTAQAFSGRCESILQLIENQNASVLIAGVNAGYPPNEMIPLIKRCEDVLRFTKVQELGGNFNNYRYVFDNLALHMPTLSSLEILAGNVRQGKSRGGNTGPKTGRNDERDLWIYTEINKDGEDELSLDEILAELKTQCKLRGWGHIGSVQGLRQAAGRYATRKLLKPPRKRLSS